MIRRPLVTINLANDQSNRYIIAKVYRPSSHKVLCAVTGLHSRVWKTKYSLQIDNVSEHHEAAGVDWLQSFCMAIEGIRLAIPVREVEHWKSPDGVPAWAIIPHNIPIAWGYEFYRNGVQMIDAAEKEKNEEIERKWNKPS